MITAHPNLAVATRVLIVEDNEHLAFGLRMALEAHGYVVEVANDGSAALAPVRCMPADVMLLDLLLPKLDGFSVASVIRAEFPRIRIIVLSALNQESDKVRAFRLGVHDYVTKPFGIMELIERVRVQVRMVEPRERESIFQCGGLHFDLARREVTRDGAVMHLSRLERELLFALIDANGAVCTKEYLLQKVWRHKHLIPTRTIDYHIGRLRAKLEDDPHAPKMILTEWKTGYRFHALDPEWDSRRER